MRTAIVDRTIEVAALLNEVAGNHNGATLAFIGTVRDVNDGRAVTGMEYTAYRGMAERKLATIAREAVESFGTNDIIVEHRLGMLGLREASVAVVVPHPHPGAAYAASRYVIEQLKKRVPIWKLEHYVDGTREWVDPTGSGSSAVSGAREPIAASRSGGNAQ